MFKIFSFFPILTLNVLFLRHRDLELRHLKSSFSLRPIVIFS